MKKNRVNLLFFFPHLLFNFLRRARSKYVWLQQLYLARVYIIYPVQSFLRIQNLLRNSLTVLHISLDCHSSFRIPFPAPLSLVFLLWNVQFSGKRALNGTIQQVTPYRGAPLHLDYPKSRRFVIPRNLANLNCPPFLSSSIVQH